MGFSSDSTGLLSRGSLVKLALRAGLANTSADDSAHSVTRSAISAGALRIVDEAGQQALNNLTDFDWLTDSATHTPLQRIDLNALQTEVNASAAIKEAFIAQVEKRIDKARQADDAKETIFLSKNCLNPNLCEITEVDLTRNESGIAHDENGNVYVFNPGIFNSQDTAIANSAAQHNLQANKTGIHIIYNPPTGDIIAEIMYAGADKLREMTGWTGLLGISNASIANDHLREKVAEYNRNRPPGAMELRIVEVNHSRGALVSSITSAHQLKNGVTDTPIKSILFNGAAANAQRAANRLNIVTSGKGELWQSTHYFDQVSRLIGGNPSTGGSWPGGDPISAMFITHIYGFNVRLDYRMRTWGDIPGIRPESRSILVLPNSVRSK